MEIRVGFVRKFWTTCTVTKLRGNHDRVRNIFVVSRGGIFSIDVVKIGSVLVRTSRQHYKMLLAIDQSLPFREENLAQWLCRFLRRQQSDLTVLLWTSAPTSREDAAFLWQVKLGELRNTSRPPGHFLLLPGARPGRSFTAEPVVTDHVGFFLCLLLLVNALVEVEHFESVLAASGLANLNGWTPVGWSHVDRWVISLST